MPEITQRNDFQSLYQIEASVLLKARNARPEPAMRPHENPHKWRADDDEENSHLKYLYQRKPDINCAK